ncbi:inositol polyphosphate 1-phosphatase-like [Megalops cyprinoides]|uniref:inositol polyphosphate 1-phosphatase-like n=1 Tax=Megalops cyprinoides TaxID=118141 RepID=UPI001863AB81|nr:inositol polyphosphate 1-phosphatase-like [Megalops cyprinoides]XP_036401090.1 inositol polyphosphate 1-phosphatase-like [Megalops cyprinoides]XP_036401091.1 inositol polyphosphate 1-phosphatase-like [Megalops cyprinoides]
MSELLHALVRASEKAANIARACRQEESLFSLLIEEKKEGEKNKKFVTDFKTLADVLVQEVIKHDVGKQFPGLGNNIFGEESNEFMNGLGEKIQVQVCETEQDTSRLLSKVLGGNMEAAEVLARAAHADIVISNLGTGDIDIPVDDLGVWVDPIDSTFQYIKGIDDSVPNNNIYSQGLQCVTVLIGAYHLQTGVPVMGVINQPFAVLDPKTQRWTGQYYWGISSGSCNANFLQSPVECATEEPDSKRMTSSQKGALSSAVLSTGEAENVKSVLLEACKGQVHYAAGAGYKSLCVVLGLVDVYVFSEDTTFKWDCCSPHAILRSMGGGMADLKECLRLRHDGKLEERPELVYNNPVTNATGADKWANKGGLIAYRSQAHLDAVLKLLSTIPV